MNEDDDMLQLIRAHRETALFDFYRSFPVSPVSFPVPSSPKTSKMANTTARPRKGEPAPIPLYWRKLTTPQRTRSPPPTSSRTTPSPSSPGPTSSTPHSNSSSPDHTPSHPSPHPRLPGLSPPRERLASSSKA